MIALSRTRAAALVWLAGGAFAVTTVSASAGDPPRLSSVAPSSVRSGGSDPIRISVLGSNLRNVTAVHLFPAVQVRSFLVYNDSTVLVTLPPSIPTGSYSIQVDSPDGPSDALAEPVFSVSALAPPPPQDQPPSSVDLPPPGARPSYAPPPDDPGSASQQTQPPSATASNVAPAVMSASPPSKPSGGTNPFWMVGIGLLLGGVAYTLWGSGGRVSMARRHGFLAQVVARPAQRLRIGRICRQCGRVHWLWRTRRDLWRSGDYCSAICFVTGQEAELSQHFGEEVASSRLRDVVVYNDLEQRLAAVFLAAPEQAGVDDLLSAADAAAAITAPLRGARVPTAWPTDDADGHPPDPQLGAQAVRA
ncbi:MAG TPA: hypothetical protein VG266_03895 [Candidatus Dormibacteraeota bacterium]|nr:hypothetical protein [Candidatus Dormibacteraeota bacterium]